jgi:predicted O-methyltransferase YrrM
MSPLPQRIRSAAPASLRDNVRVRSLAVGAGVIPPRALHSDDERALLCALAAEAGTVVEIGVYEGASASVLCDVMRPSARLHLIDPFGHHPTALREGWAATEWASRRVVGRAIRRGGPQVVWHVEFSQDTAQRWTDGPVDLLFIDGDHAEEAVRLDWDRWHGHIAPGGHVLFHDAREGKPEGRGLPGPTAVVDALFRGPDAVPGWIVSHEVDRTVGVRRLEG